MSWLPMRLGDVLTLKRGHDLPDAARRPGDIPVVSSSGTTGWHDEAKAKAPGVVTGRYGTLGEVYYVEQDFWPLNTALYVVDFKGNQPRFAAYLLQHLLKDQGSDKAAVPGVNRNVLHELEVRCPPPAVQQRVVQLLSAYDDLIENNRRRMALLEDAARQVYREWFVRLRFPGREHTLLVDGVPQGWRRASAAQVLLVNPRTPLPDSVDHPSVEMADLAVNEMSIKGVGTSSSRAGSKFVNGDTLFARITPCLENGKTAFVDCLENGVVARGSTEFIVLRSKELTPEYVYCLARTYDFRENAIKSMVGSSGRQRVQDSCFEKFLVVVPPRRVLDEFTETVRPMFRQVRTLHAQNARLRAARDLLLPRLMSGEIAV